MGSTLIFKQKRSLYTKRGFTVEIRLELFKIDGSHSEHFPEGYRFGFIAFDRFDPENRILFDCHPPKGPHLHIMGDPVGQIFEWQSLEETLNLFWKKVWDHFGEHEDEGDGE